MCYLFPQGKRKKIRACAVQRQADLKSNIKLSDARLKAKDRITKPKKEDPSKINLMEKPQVSSALFFEYNTQLGPPYHIILDTNFINFSIKNKIDINDGMMDCLLAKCTPYVTDCVKAELEKLGHKYKLALRIISDPRFQRMPCMHKGDYADDCIVNRVTQHKCYIVATNDKDLKRRLRKIPGVPIMSVALNRFVIERMPDAFDTIK